MGIKHVIERIKKEANLVQKTIDSAADEVLMMLKEDATNYAELYESIELVCKQNRFKNNPLEDMIMGSVKEKMKKEILSLSIEKIGSM